MAPSEAPNGAFCFSSLRVVTLEGNPWFVTRDVAKVLELPNITDTLKSKYIDPSEKAMKIIGGREVNIIAESALYKLAMRSKKPQAKGFQDWVTKEVLPSIRKTGAYVTGQPSLVENPQMDHYSPPRWAPKAEIHNTILYASPDTR